MKRAGGDGVVTHRRRRRGDSSRAGVTNRSADKTTRRTAREKKRNTQPDDAADAPEAAASQKGNGVHLDAGLDYNVVGEALYAKIHAVDPDRAGKITGMMLEVGLRHAVMLTVNDHWLRNCVAQAQAVLLQHEAASAAAR